jgi:hypothetical protein
MTFRPVGLRHARALRRHRPHDPRGRRPRAQPRVLQGCPRAARLPGARPWSAAQREISFGAAGANDFAISTEYPASTSPSPPSRASRSTPSTPRARRGRHGQRQPWSAARVLRALLRRLRPGPRRRQRRGRLPRPARGDLGPPANRRQPAAMTAGAGSHPAGRSLRAGSGACPASASRADAGWQREVLRLVATLLERRHRPCAGPVRGDGEGPVGKIGAPDRVQP